MTVSILSVNVTTCTMQKNLRAADQEQHLNIRGHILLFNVASH